MGLWSIVYRIITLPIAFFSLFGGKPDIIGKEIALLNKIDNAQTAESLLIYVDAALNSYINEQVSIQVGKARVIIWNELPSDKNLKEYFVENFNILKYDKTHGDFDKKQFDYTRQSIMSDGKTWEKFIFTKVQDKTITLFLSYTMKSSINKQDLLKIEQFFTSALNRMFDKLLNPMKSVFSHGMSLTSHDKLVKYIVVYYDNQKGFVEENGSSFEDGLNKQAEIDKRQLSSCILTVENGKKNLHSIRHPTIKGHVIPDFHAHYIVSTKHKEHHSPVHDFL